MGNTGLDNQLYMDESLAFMHLTLNLLGYTYCQYLHRPFIYSNGSSQIDMYNYAIGHLVREQP